MQLSVSPTSLSFGSATVGTSTSQVITISSTGNSGVSVSQIVVSGTAYSVTDVTMPISLSAGQSISFTVVFAPLSAGSLPGSISIVSTATNFPLTIALSGSGVQAASHSVGLTWSDSSTGVAGYNIYRGTTSGGPYAKVNSVLVPISHIQIRQCGHYHRFGASTISPQPACNGARPKAKMPGAYPRSV
jgi:hypothetical protein